MDALAVLGNSTILEAAWLRVRHWYLKGEWIPQPEFARWEYDSDSMLDELGRELSSGTYAPSPMPLLPHAKKKGRLRHYCQPSVRDQVAFSLFGVLLAPLLEQHMPSFSFGNRWFRRQTQEKDDSSIWKPRNWSLADRDFYQPYGRAHGLFRRVASWTVGAMLGCEPASESSLGPITKPEEYGDDLLPNFARTSYWQNHPKTDRAYWARFDLKLAFPSVRIDALRRAMKGIVARLFPATTQPSLADQLRLGFLSDNLRLFDVSIHQHLMEPSNVGSLIDYLCDLLEQVRYVPFDESDDLFFPDDPKSPNPEMLPFGDGANHPGLPTGLAISGLLLNAYLHTIDVTMAEWFSPRFWPTQEPGQPAAFLRFVDDMVLVAGAPSVLVDGIDRLMSAVESHDPTSDLNLRMNWDKAQPEPVAEMLKAYRKPSAKPKESLLEWVQKSKKGRTLFLELERDAITEETRGPFVTELVERLSDLGAEKQIDLLPVNARVRLARLQEIVLFKPDDSVVPRETQLVFAANQLIRAWLPEEDRKQDASLLAEIRRSVGDALREASDKPRLWRAVWRIAIRRPISSGAVNEDLLQEEDERAKKWLLSIVGRFAESSLAEKFVPPGVEKENLLRWNRIWPMFSSFQRAAIWRAFADVAHDVQHNAQRLAEDGAFAPSHSWLYRSSDEQTLCRMVDWMTSMATECMTRLYDKADPLTIWESESLAIALATLIPRRSVVATHSGISASSSFIRTVASLVEKHQPEWSSIAARLRSSEVDGRQTSLPELLLLTSGRSADEGDAARSLAATTTSPNELLRLMTATHWRKHVVDQIRRASQLELQEHPQRLAEARSVGPGAVRRELNRYQLARQTLLASGGPLQ